jgi:hypothetical protein
MVDLNAHETGNGGKKPREAYSLPSLLYSEKGSAFYRSLRTDAFIRVVPDARPVPMPS